MLTPDRYAIAEQLFHEAKDLPPHEWTAILGARCADDSEVLRFVRQLLETHQATADTEGEQVALPEYEIPGYEIVRPIGSGGMGVVYLARQKRPPRQVAIKLVKPACLRGEFLRRFEFEANALARLRHPGIAAIYDAGTVDSSWGRLPYFAMEYVDGQTLLRFADANKLPTNARLQLLAKICDAVHHAHLQGVVHRDLKPGNILITQDASPKILDFGLARSLECDVQATFATLPGQIAGTLQYMSPEQTYGDSTQIDLRTDIYSLGVLGYELLAGHPPYKLDPRAPFDAIQVIREEEPSLLSAVSRTLGGDIAAVVGKAMSKEKKLRYDAAAGLRDDIINILENKPVVARRLSTVYRLRKLVRRNRAAFAAAVVGALMMLLASIAAGLYVLWLPGWADSHIRAARLSLLNPAVGELIYQDVHLPEQDGSMGRWHDTAFTVAPKYESALREYDTALWAYRLRPERQLLLTERDTVAIAAALIGNIPRPSLAGAGWRHSQLGAESHAGRDTQEAYRDSLPVADPHFASYLERLQGVAPLTALVARTAFETPLWRASLDDIVTKDRIQKATPLDLRCLGLLAYLVGKSRLCSDAWSAAGVTIADAPDPLIDGALGELCLTRGEAGSALARLDRATRAFPRVGFLLTNLADAAVLARDLPSAGAALKQIERLLDDPAKKDSFDPFETHRRVQADFWAARNEAGDAERAEQEYQWLRANHSSGTNHLHYAQFLAKNGRLAEAAAVLHSLVRSRPHYQQYGVEFVQVSELWWARASHAEKRRLIRRAMDLHPADPQSLVTYLRDYWERATVATEASATHDRRRHLASRQTGILDIEFPALVDALAVEDSALWARIMRYPPALKETLLRVWSSNADWRTRRWLSDRLDGLARAATFLTDAARYDVHDLGTLGGAHSVAHALSNDGKVVGYAAARSDRGAPPLIPFVWTPSARGALDGAMRCLAPDLRGGQAVAINDAGTVVGSLSVGVNAKPVLWSDGAVTELPAPADLQCGEARGLNNRDHAVGWLSPSPRAPQPKAAFWRNSSVELLGAADAIQSVANDINDAGAIVGWSQRASGWRRATLWTSEGGLVELETPGWSESTAMAINADGVVVGTLSDPSSKRKRPFRWINGSLSELPLVDEEACAAAAINSKNQIVGGCQLATGLSAACLWTESGVVNLNDLVPAGSGWHLVSADDINDRGEITGTGYIATEMHAFFLSPRMPPEPRVDPED